ncbi:MAG: methylmalonyl-CoA mutase family protein [Myxococcota bacterium]
MTAIDLKQWEDKVKSELKGKAWQSVFNKCTADGIVIPPVCTAKDRPESTWIAKPRLNWSRVWRLEPEAQNRDILEVLNLGADTLWIRFERTGYNGHRSGWSNTDIEHWKALTAGVHLSLLHVVVEVGDHPEDVKALFDALCPDHPTIVYVNDLVSDSIIEAKQTHSSMVPVSNTTLAQLIGATPVQELELHLRCWAMALDANESGFEQCAKSIQIVLPADAHIFETVAKFRAIRQLWHAFWSCCGVEVDPRITAITSPRMMADIDEYTNILRCTHASTGAILGGCDSLCILPFDYRLSVTMPDSCRMSVITHAILEEESLLGCIQDPMSGSYYVEQLTEALAEKAWSAFRRWRLAGARTILDNDLRKRIIMALDKRFEAIAHRRLPLTSISEFPHIEAVFHSRATHWALKSGTLMYDSDVFTDLRRRLLARTSNPTLTILCIGQEAQWTARYHFAMNAFAVGGWKHVQQSILNATQLSEALSKIPMNTPVCICAPNVVYSEIVDSGWATKRPLYLAGPPTIATQIGAMPIHLGCNLRQVLLSLCEPQGDMQ